MLFYVKKYLWLDLLVTVFLGGLGYFGMRYFSLPLRVSVTWIAFAEGLIGLFVVGGWTLAVQKGYAIFRGEEYAKNLTISLAKEYSDASITQAVFGGITAAIGEELFFRGFIQGEWGILAGSLLFGFAHFGKKDIRVVSYWSFAHGLLFGLAYLYTRNLLVPMLAHGLFDLGGVIYFRQIMQRQNA